MIDIKEAAKKYNGDINNSYIRTSLYEAAVKHYQAEMQAEGYEWLKVDKWISVEDRLPTEEDADENGEVLWLSGGHNHRIDLWDVNTEVCGDTHWQPLPSLPK